MFASQAEVIGVDLADEFFGVFVQGISRDLIAPDVVKGSLHARRRLVLLHELVEALRDLPFVDGLHRDARHIEKFRRGQQMAVGPEFVAGQVFLQLCLKVAVHIALFVEALVLCGFFAFHVPFALAHVFPKSEGKGGIDATHLLAKFVGHAIIWVPQHGEHGLVAEQRFLDVAGPILHRGVKQVAPGDVRQLILLWNQFPPLHLTSFEP
mmetsp:Transcript_38030/g.47127  ORF Transcript_38030/g.47127 Transcript_38030/m.47127 type:complete len:209 (-) Transcript_38030:210-836(-)